MYEIYILYPAGAMEQCTLIGNAKKILLMCCRSESRVLSDDCLSIAI